ncbi:Copia protein, partial [Mucuna pruriens]
MTFFHSHCVNQEITTGRTIGVFKKQDGLYYLQHTKIGNNTNMEELPSSQRATLETWVASQSWLYHKYLGNPLFWLLKTMFPHLFIKESVESFKCDICQFLKHYHATFSPSNNKSLEPFDLIHSNVWGQLVTLYQEVSEGCHSIEFVNLEFSKFLKDNSVVHELMCMNTPQQNGVARVILFQMFVPNVYWGEAILIATYLINRLLTQVLNGISQIKHMLSFFPSSLLILSLLSRVSGCIAFVHSHNPHCEKLDPKAIKCAFIGYLSNKMNFKGFK